jgi:hypothetical protein
VVITSNSERRLPEPFLRRCVFHHLEMTEELLRRAVTARVADFPRLGADVREAAIRRFLELRGQGIRKKPATAELLVWLTMPWPCGARGCPWRRRRSGQRRIGCAGPTGPTPHPPSARGIGPPSYRIYSVGFRCVRTPE